MNLIPKAIKSKPLWGGGMLEEVIRNCTDKQREILRNWPLESLSPNSRKAFMRAINDNFHAAFRYSSRHNSFREWFNGYKGGITKFIQGISEGLDEIAKLEDEEARSKIIQIYAVKTKGQDNLENFGYQLTGIVYHLKTLASKKIDIARVMDLELKTVKSKNWDGYNSFDDLVDLILNGGIERAEYVREVLDTFRRKCHDEESNLLRHANEIINSGADFKEFCNLYSNYVSSIKGGNYYLKEELLEAAPKIINAGGIGLLKKSITGMDWLSQRTWAAKLWFPKVPEFHQRDILEKKKRTLKGLALKKRNVAYELWKASVPKSLQHLEDEIKIFVAPQQYHNNQYPFYPGESVPHTLKSICEYLRQKANPAKKLDELVQFRQKNKHIGHLSPSRTVKIMRLYGLLRGGSDSLKEDIRDSTKLVAELPDVYGRLIGKIPKREALDAVEYLRHNYVKTVNVSAERIADLVLLYRENGWELPLLGRDMEPLGRYLFDLPLIYEKLTETALEGKAKSIVNHLRKRHSRTLMNEAKEVVLHEVFGTFAKQIPEDAGKRDIVDIVQAYFTSLKSAQAHNIMNRFVGKIKRMKYGLTIPEVISQLSVRKLIATKYVAFAGTNKIPEEYAGVVDKCMAAEKNLNKYESKSLSLLMTAHLKSGDLGAYEQARELDGNAQLYESQKERIDHFRNMPTLTYEVKREGKKTLRDVINDEFLQIQDILRPLGIEARNIPEINLDRIPDQYRDEIALHITNIKNAEFRNSNMQNITFYLGKDFIENLQMGDFFGSCLSIGQFNFKYTLQHCVDINKGVI